MKIRSRLAPTPSGQLHLGNGVNFLQTWLRVRKAGGVLKLRIDDLDSNRCRPEYIEDIFRQLDWLGLDWDEGPTGPENFHRHFSQRLRRERYWEVLTGLWQGEHLFACTCSRKEIQQRSPSGLYPGTCRQLDRQPSGPYALRLRVEAGAGLELEGHALDLSRALGDFVVWRRDAQPAYQLASLVDDLDDRINLLVRGDDLQISTAAQLYLAAKLGREEFAQATFIHHPLMLGGDGRKLSKSDNALSLAALQARGATPLLAYRAVACQLGINPDEITGLDDLLAALPPP
ncbi:MAG: tRNA glutamyl-Q synthetase [Desulfobulbaceae bacterium]|nr:tRNA glutamyl-Q synthetase [Desulfobulbaceae bacterium]